MSALGMEPIDTSANFTVTQFGNFTANFKEVPPPIPPEYWVTLFSVIVTALVGTWLIPSIIGWTKSKRQHRSLRQYRKIINSLNSSKSDNQVKRETPEGLKNEVTDA
jgi:uncharacterized membrane protein (DUF106 family)